MPPNFVAPISGPSAVVLPAGYAEPAAISADEYPMFRSPVTAWVIA